MTKLTIDGLIRARDMAEAANKQLKVVCTQAQLDTFASEFACFDADLNNVRALRDGYTDRLWRIQFQRPPINGELTIDLAHAKT